MANTRWPPVAPQSYGAPFRVLANSSSISIERTTCETFQAYHFAALVVIPDPQKC